MTFVILETIEEKEIVPGFYARMVHSDNMTFAYWRVKAGASLPEHNHHHEQVCNLLDGEFELVVDGEKHHMKPGMVFVLPSNIPHAGTSITDCRILDVFHPVREDYR